jgi:hypothetical protein
MPNNRNQQLVVLNIHSDVAEIEKNLKCVVLLLTIIKKDKLCKRLKDPERYSDIKYRYQYQFKNSTVESRV